MTLPQTLPYCLHIISRTSTPFAALLSYLQPVNVLKSSKIEFSQRTTEMRTLDRLHGKDDGRESGIARSRADGRKGVHHPKGVLLRGGRDRDDGPMEHHSHNGRPSEVKPEEAIDSLYKATAKASAYFSRQKEEFRRETEGIQAYASSRILTELWREKWEVGNRSKSDAKATQERHTKNHALLEGDYTSVARKLDECLRVAVSATKHDLDLTLYTKIRDMDKAIVEMLHKIRSHRGALDKLLNELEVLSVVLEQYGARNESHHGGGRDKKVQNGSNNRDKPGHRTGNPDLRKGRREEPQHREQSEYDDQDQQRGEQSEEEEYRRNDRDDGGQDQDDQEDFQNQDEPERDINSEEEES